MESEKTNPAAANPVVIDDDVSLWDATGEVPRGRLEPGARLGGYELIRVIGVGGKGQVWAARDIRLGRRVAIKFISLPNSDSVSRFLVEARATAQCQHENIIVVYQIDEFGGTPYMVLEYLEGESLEELLARGPISPRRAVDMGSSILRALEKAHSLEIIHRDLKPANVFRTKSGVVKVLDFGMAKATLVSTTSQDTAPPQFDDEKTIVGSLSGPTFLSQKHLDNNATVVGTMNNQEFLGTPAYMAPEQLEGQVVDGRADIWAFGIVMYQLLAGVHPFGNFITLENLVQVSNRSQKMPTAAAIAGIPPKLAAIIDRCLEKDIEKRFDSPTSVLKAFKEMANQRERRALPPGSCPYLGLNAFQATDSARFYGRQADTRRAVASLDDQTILSVVGPSGAGKSSFIRAGLGPALSGNNEQWNVITTRPGRDPISGLAAVISGAQKGVEKEKDLARRLRSEPGFVGRVLRRWSRRTGKRVLLFIDQFEELYTQSTTLQDRKAYTKCLAAIADDVASPLRVAVAMRSDFMGRVAEDAEFMTTLSNGLMFLTPLGRKGLREALERPLDNTEFSFESENLVNSILNELDQTTGALPLLQFAATQLWDARDKENKILTEAAYQAMGGVTGALVAHAEQIMRDMGPSADKDVRAIFQRLVTQDMTREIVGMRELELVGSDKETTRKLIERLVRARLLVVNTDAADPTVELIHESLISNWPMLALWIKEGKDELAFLSQLRAIAKLWDNRGRPDGVLWRGNQLKEARKWHLKLKDSLQERETAFLASSLRENAKYRRARKMVIGTASVAAAIVLVVGSVAVTHFQVQNQELEKTKQSEVKANLRVGGLEENLEEKTRRLEKALAKAEKNKKRAEEARKSADEARRIAEGANKLAQRKTDELSIKINQLNKTAARLEQSLEKERDALKRARRNKRGLSDSLD